jgi:hypothetical protein
MAGVALLGGMQPSPRLDTDGAVLVVLTGQGGGRDRPGGRVGAVELGPVATRPARAAGWPWWRVGVAGSGRIATAPAPPRGPRQGPGTAEPSRSRRRTQTMAPTRRQAAAPGARGPARRRCGRCRPAGAGDDVRLRLRARGRCAACPG